MKSRAKVICLAAVAWSFLLLAADPKPGSSPLNQEAMSAGPVGSGTNVTSVMYFDPPNEQQIKVRLSGAEMSSLPGAMYDVKKLKIERFGEDGKLQAVAVAPECIYAPMDGVANSDGPLELTMEDGKMRLQGQGFQWQQEQSLLVISNRVHTIIKMGNWKLTTP
jgi:hypothetical protein